MSASLAVVITTIQAPTASVIELASAVARIDGASLIVIGDAKSPPAYDLSSASFVSLDAQYRLSFKVTRLIPPNHYSRKNVGYLMALQAGASILYETDDDNAPNEYWSVRSLLTTASAVGNKEWLNAYSPFSKELIWPRGLPLTEVQRGSISESDAGVPAQWEAPIQQGLADESPDVDAIWRLLFDRPFEFERRGSIRLDPGCWCPFNSQTTWWWPPAFPLLYLPSYCSFRMTDIWRSFVAQRCLWEMNQGVVFHAPEVRQERNVHNLLKDFEAEVPGYTQNGTIAKLLAGVSLVSGPANVSANVMRCYETLVQGGILPAEEISLVTAWLEDVDALTNTGSHAFTKAV